MILLRNGLELLEENLYNALDEVASLKCEVEGRVLRSSKQPPSKVAYDKAHYATAATILPRPVYERLRSVLEARGVTVSYALRRFVYDILRESGAAFGVSGK